MILAVLSQREGIKMTVILTISTHDWYALIIGLPIAFLVGLLWLLADEFGHVRRNKYND